MQPKGDIVLIIGANGRIGTALMRRLSKRFDNVVSFNQKAQTPPPPPDCVRIPRSSLPMKASCLNTTEPASPPRADHKGQCMWSEMNVFN